MYRLFIKKSSKNRSCLLNIKFKYLNLSLSASVTGKFSKKYYSLG